MVKGGSVKRRKLLGAEETLWLKDVMILGPAASHTISSSNQERKSLEMKSNAKGGRDNRKERLEHSMMSVLN